MGNEEKLFDTFGEYLDKCGDVEFDFFCDDLYCDHTVVWNSYNDKLTEKAKENGTNCSAQNMKLLTQMISIVSDR